MGIIHRDAKEYEGGIITRVGVDENNCYVYYFKDIGYWVKPSGVRLAVYKGGRYIILSADTRDEGLKSHVIKRWDRRSIRRGILEIVSAVAKINPLIRTNISLAWFDRHSFGYTGTPRAPGLGIAVPRCLREKYGKTYYLGSANTEALEQAALERGYAFKEQMVQEILDKYGISVREACRFTQHNPLENRRVA